MACSTVSVVSTPKITGTPVSRPTWAVPLVTSAAIMSKWGVPPRITAPSTTTPAYLPGLGHLLGHLGQFEGAGYPEEVDLGFAAAMAEDAIHGAAHQAIHDEFVEPCGHQGEPVALVHTQLAFKDPHGNPPKGG